VPKGLFQAFDGAWDQSPMLRNPLFCRSSFGMISTNRAAPTMKPNTRKLIILALFAAGSAMFSLAGCAGVGSSNSESLLTAAGFRVRTPETPRQKQIYAALPAYKVHRATVNGKVFYVYKDEKAGVAYVGHEPEYQRYKQLAIQQRIAEDNYMAAEMERDAALSWYGGFGVSSIWW
jgi:hypothetical protein